MNADTGVSRSPVMSKGGATARSSSYVGKTKNPSPGSSGDGFSGAVRSSLSRQNQTNRQPTPLRSAPPPKTRAAERLLRHARQYHRRVRETSSEGAPGPATVPGPRASGALPCLILPDRLNLDPQSDLLSETILQACVHPEIRAVEGPQRVGAADLALEQR